MSTSRGFDSRAGLTPSERQLSSLDECSWNFQRTDRGVGLSFLAEDSWSRVKLTRDATDTFIHWYVDFQFPPARFGLGYDTCDLVIDIMVMPDRTWRWKDREHFEDGVRRGIFSPEMENSIRREADVVIGRIEAGEGPFAAEWLDWTPDPTWEVPGLPPGYRDGVSEPAGGVWLPG